MREDKFISTWCCVEPYSQYFLQSELNQDEDTAASLVHLFVRQNSYNELSLIKNTNLSSSSSSSDDSLRKQSFSVSYHLQE